MDLVEIALARRHGGGSSGSGSGSESTVEYHVCGQNDYDSQTGLPTVQNPEEGVFYLVPSGEQNGNNLFEEYVYINNNWEKFGGGSLVVPLNNLVDGSTAGSVRGINTLVENSSYTMGINAFAEGNGTAAIGTAAHASGSNTVAVGNNSFSEGEGTNITLYLTGGANSNTYNSSGSLNALAFCKGRYVKIDNEIYRISYINPEGNQIVFDKTLDANSALSNTAKMVTILNTAYGDGSHVEGSENTAYNSNSHAEGHWTLAEGNASHAEGISTTAGSSASMGPGAAHAEGYGTRATGDYSHSEGYNTYASTSAAHAEGILCESLAMSSHAEGYNSISSGDSAHSEGTHTLASGNYSHAENDTTTASGESSHCEGFATIANHKSQHVFGEFNIADSSNANVDAKGTYVEIVGNGTTDEARSNARTLDWNGNETLSGKLTVGADPTNDMDVSTKRYVDNKTVIVDSTLNGSSSNAIQNKTVKAAIDSVETKANAAMAGVGAPLVALTASGMTNTEKVYVYTGNETGYTAGNWYYYNGSSWVSGGVYNAVAVNTDKTLSIENMAADAAAVGSLKDALNSDYVKIIHGNIFATAELLYENGYASITDGHVSNKQLSNDYNAYIIQVDGESVYSFTACRFAFLLGSDKDTAIGNLLENVTQIDSTDASYICFSVKKTEYSLESYVVSKGTSLDTTERMSDIEPVTTMQTKISNLEASDDELKNRFDRFEYNNGVNLFGNSELLSDSGYGSINDGKISVQSNSNYSCYLLPVDGISAYNFQFCRFAFLVDSDKETVIGDLLQNVSKITSTSAHYICFSFNHSDYPVDDYWVCGIVNGDKKPKFESVTGSLSNGGNLQMTSCRNDLRKNERIVFEGDITTFSSLKIGLSFSQEVGTAANQKNTFLIDSTSISYYASNTSTPVVVQFPNDYVITNNLQIIWEMTETASCFITLISNGVLFKHEFTSFQRQTIGNPYVLSINTSMTNCKLIWTCTDLEKNIWMFGDSYFSYSNLRWTYYLHEYGYDKNCLLNGYAGENYANEVRSIGNLLKYGTPRFAVWCEGMNDGTDSSSSPSANWISGRDAFLSYCEDAGIIPVFGTIPTVPGNNPPTTFLNHEQKNAWIRSSGYRYIDFAKAVGATAEGTWYSGMLSGDGTHPTETGAKALFARALLDLPEIMVDN